MRVKRMRMIVTSNIDPMIKFVANVTLEDYPEDVDEGEIIGNIQSNFLCEQFDFEFTTVSEIDASVCEEDPVNVYCDPVLLSK